MYFSLQTTVVTQNQISSRLEKYFDDPSEFKPERWLKDENLKKPDINPYVSLPFGHGMRSCIARRFAEQNLLVLLLRVGDEIILTSIFVFVTNFYFN